MKKIFFILPIILLLIGFNSCQDDDFETDVQLKRNPIYTSKIISFEEFKNKLDTNLDLKVLTQNASQYTTFSDDYVKSIDSKEIKCITTENATTYTFKTITDDTSYFTNYIILETETGTEEIYIKYNPENLEGIIVNPTTGEPENTTNSINPCGFSTTIEYICPEFLHSSMDGNLSQCNYNSLQWIDVTIVNYVPCDTNNIGGGINNDVTDPSTSSGGGNNDENDWSDSSQNINDPILITEPTAEDIGRERLTRQLNEALGEGNWEFVEDAGEGAPYFDNIQDIINNSDLKLTDEGNDGIQPLIDLQNGEVESEVFIDLFELHYSGIKVKIKTINHGQSNFSFSTDPHIAKFGNTSFWDVVWTDPADKYDGPFADFINNQTVVRYDLELTLKKGIISRYGDLTTDWLFQVSLYIDPNTGEIVWWRFEGDLPE